MGIISGVHALHGVVCFWVCVIAACVCVCVCLSVYVQSVRVCMWSRVCTCACVSHIQFVTCVVGVLTCMCASSVLSGGATTWVQTYVARACFRFWSCLLAPRASLPARFRERSHPRLCAAPRVSAGPRSRSFCRSAVFPFVVPVVCLAAACTYSVSVVPRASLPARVRTRSAGPPQDNRFIADATSSCAPDGRRLPLDGVHVVSRVGCIVRQ